jgi:hypothetical protein
MKTKAKKTQRKRKRITEEKKEWKSVLGDAEVK